MAFPGVEGAIGVRKFTASDLLIGWDPVEEFGQHRRITDIARGELGGAASQLIPGSNQIVSQPRRLTASLSAGQFRVLQAGGVGLLMHPSDHAGLTR